MDDHVRPHYDTSALVLIDVQRDFIDGAMPVPGTAEVLPRLVALAEGFRAAGRPVAHVIRLYQPGGSDVDLVRRASIEAGVSIVAPGTPGAGIPSSLVGDLEPDGDLLLSGEPQPLGEREVIIAKPRWSAFHRTGLEEWLRGWDVDTVVVAGCNLPNCPRATLFDASERDLRTVLVTDAVSQTSEERLADLQLIGVTLAPTDAVLARLR